MSDTGQDIDLDAPDDEAIVEDERAHIRDREAENSERVSFVELFFDLVFVFAVTQLASTLAANVSAEGAVRGLVLFGAVWWAWINTSWATNRLDPDGAVVRVVIFALMGGSLVMAASLPRAFDDRALPFAAAYVAIQVGRSFFAAWALRQHEERRESRLFVRQGAWFILSGALWLAGALAEAEARILLWAAALGVELLIPWWGFRLPGLGRSAIRDWDVEGEHLSERCGLFVILSLGETLLVTGARAASLEWDRVTVAAALTALAGTLVMWWVYFDTGAKRGTRAFEEERHAGRLARVAYTYLHMPIVAGIVLAAVGDKGLLDHPLDAPTWKDAVMLIGGPALFLLGNFLFKNATSRRWPLSHLVGLALLGGGVLASERLSVLALALWAVAALAAVAALERGLLRSSAAAAQGIK